MIWTNAFNYRLWNWNSRRARIHAANQCNRLLCGDTICMYIELCVIIIVQSYFSHRCQMPIEGKRAKRLNAMATVAQGKMENMHEMANWIHTLLQVARFAESRYSAWAPKQIHYFARASCTKLNRKSHTNSVVLVPSRCLRAFPSRFDSSYTFAVPHSIHTIFMQFIWIVQNFALEKKIIEKKKKCFCFIRMKIGFDGR